MDNIDEILNKFKIIVNEDEIIVNIVEFKNNLDEATIDDALKTYLTTLNNRIKNSNFKNKNVLSNAINAKLLDYQAKKQKKMDNRESLNKMIMANEDLKKLGIISTKAEYNDSNKDIDYLTYTDDSGVTEMLVCESANTLNDYITTHADTIATMSAKEVFHHFKEYIHVDLSFVDPTKPEEINALNHNDQKYQDDEVLAAEYEEVKKYSEKYSLGCLPEVTIDPNGERIYRLNDGLFKFKTVENKREMMVLRTPTVNYNTEDLLAELDGDNKDYNTMEAMQPIDKKEKAIPNKYDDISVTMINEENVNRVMELIQKRDVYGAELTNEELMEIDRMIKTLIESMVDRVKENKTSDLDDLLDDYIKKIYDKRENQSYENDEQGKLTDLEIEFIEKYNEKMDYIKNNNLDMRKSKNLILEMNNEDNSQKGIATIVMLLEIMLLAIFILLFSHIDI